MTVRHERFRRAHSTPALALPKEEGNAVAPESDSRGRIAGRRALGLAALASLFALIGRSAARAADALTIDPNGQVKIDNLSAKIQGNNTLEFGADVSGKQVDAGKIGYQTLTPGALDVVGAGTAANARKIKFWAEGGATFAGDVAAAGTVKAQSLETNAGISLAAVQNAVNMLVPVGTIMAFGADTTKNATAAAELKKQGWLRCDGATVPEKEYGDLFKVVGKSHGSPGPGYFAVPNLHSFQVLNLPNVSWIIKAK
jgi:hypothetical protein